MFERWQENTNHMTAHHHHGGQRVFQADAKAAAAMAAGEFSLWDTIHSESSQCFHHLTSMHTYIKPQVLKQREK